VLGAVTEAATKQEEGEEGDGSPPPSPDVLLNQFRSLVGLRGWPVAGSGSGITQSAWFVIVSYRGACLRW